MWKMMDKTEKDRYFQYARQVDAEHKKKFPGIKYILSNNSAVRNKNLIDEYTGLT